MRYLILAIWSGSSNVDCNRLPATSTAQYDNIFSTEATVYIRYL